MARRLIIHLGYHKTGSSSIQKWLLDHKETLSDHLLCYNLADGTSNPLKLAVHRYLLDKGKRVEIKKECRRICAEIAAAPQPTACFTDEGLLGFPLGFKWHDFVETGIYPRSREIVRILAEEFAAFSPVFIIFERDSESWLRSIHNQMYKQGCVSDGFNDYLARFSPQPVNWRKLRAGLRARIGDNGQLVTCNFQKEFARHKVADMSFFQQLDLPDDVLAQCRPTLEKINPSVPLPDETAVPKLADAVSQEQVDLAYRFILGRLPNREKPPQFPNTHEMYRILLSSDEFKASGRGRKTPLGWPRAQIFISRPAKVLYCPIGKNACTFLKEQMLRISGLQQIEQILQLQDVHRLTDRTRTGIQLSDFSQEQTETFITSPEYFKFSVLRDPKDRLLSAYLEKFVRSRQAPGNISHTRTVITPVHKALGLAAPDYDRGISFRQFISQITSVAPQTLDPHWRPQSLYLEGVAYDRLYDLGEIDEVIDMLETRSGLTLPRKPKNVTGSGRDGGQHQPGAADLLPDEIEALPRLSRESFFDDNLNAVIAQYFSEDYKLLETCKTS